MAGPVVRGARQARSIPGPPAHPTLETRATEALQAVDLSAGESLVSCLVRTRARTVPGSSCSCRFVFNSQKTMDICTTKPRPSSPAPPGSRAHSGRMLPPGRMRSPVTAGCGHSRRIMWRVTSARDPSAVAMSFQRAMCGGSGDRRMRCSRSRAGNRGCKRSYLGARAATTGVRRCYSGWRSTGTTGSTRQGGETWQVVSGHAAIRR